MPSSPPYGRGNAYVNKMLDELIDAQRTEADPAKREKLIAEHNAQIHHVPLHQVIPWATRETIRAVHRADNWVEVQWVYN